MTKKLVIDASFMEEWCPKYDCSTVGGDEADYKKLKKLLKKKNLRKEQETLSEILFKKIYNWKAARALHYVDFSSLMNMKKN